MNFQALISNEPIIKAIALENIITPTEVQIQSIPAILENKNVIIQSQTGSGKTLAYLLPIFQKHPLPIVKGMTTMILVPTKELAMQVYHQAERLAQNADIPIKSIVIFGDVNMQKQADKLRDKQQIIIGTADRILEHIKKKKITAHTIQTLVLDEADKMLDKQNLASVQAVRKTLMRDTQVILVSASMPQKLLPQAEMIATGFAIIKTADLLEIPSNIEHMYLVADSRNKLDTLRAVLSDLKPQKTIIFINKLEDIRIAEEKLQYHKLNCACIHGENSKEDRKKILSNFANGTVNYLIATDLAARGLHIEGVTTVFNLNSSEDATDYLHRAGRTGRNDIAGICISIVNKYELPLIKKYENKLSIQIKPMKMYEGKFVSTSKVF